MKYWPEDFVPLEMALEIGETPLSPRVFLLYEKLYYT